MPGQRKRPRSAASKGGQEPPLSGLARLIDAWARVCQPSFCILTGRAFAEGDDQKRGGGAWGGDCVWRAGGRGSETSACFRRRGGWGKSRRTPPGPCARTRRVLFRQRSAAAKAGFSSHEAQEGHEECEPAMRGPSLHCREKLIRLGSLGSWVLRIGNTYPFREKVRVPFPRPSCEADKRLGLTLLPPPCICCSAGRKSRKGSFVFFRE